MDNSNNNYYYGSVETKIINFNNNEWCYYI